MTLYEYFVQGLGLIATVFVAVSFLQKEDRRFKFLVMVGAGIFTIHLFLLGAYAGALVGLLNTTRTWLSMTRYKGDYILAIFMMFYLVAGYFTVETWKDLLPILAGAGSTIALFKLSGLQLRYAYFLTEIAWLVYSIIVKSIGGIITNLFVLAMNSVTTYRLLKDKRDNVLPND